MIRRLRGELLEVGAEWVLVDVGGLAYEIMLPPPVRDRLAERAIGSEVELFTYHYLQSDGNKVTPYLLGFESATQREFFEKLLEVPRMGPMSALRAMVLPVAQLARAVELQDEPLLRKLPGVGRQRARDMVATLQGKLVLFVDTADLPEAAPVGSPQNETEQEALEVLTQLGFPRPDALRSLRQAAIANPDAGPDELVRLVFQQR
ncbi:MAG TPA: Holliday junction branch migration protein RuvA [Armatimonadota bacterium]|jgi:Holliday junction DNA helicase RuvA